MVSAESRSQRVVAAAERRDLVPAIMRRKPRPTMGRIDADSVA